MRVPLSGIVTGFRVRQSGTTKDKSYYGFLDVLQPGDKDYDSSLIHVLVDNEELITYFLTHYSSGNLRYIDVLVHQVENGREKVWMLISVFNMKKETEEVLND